MGEFSSGVTRLVAAIAVIALAAVAGVHPPAASADILSADTEVTWTETTLLSGDRYQNVDIEIGKRNIYIMTWEFHTGPVVMLQKSDCWGKEWSEPSDVFGEGLWNAFPAMCCYQNGTHDELIIAAGSNYITKSHDEGETFDMLSPLPIPEGCQDWRYMAVGTNASWFGGTVDPDIYVLGAMYVGEYWTGTHKLAFTKSTDWGATWSEPVFLCPDEVMQTNYPEIVSDGSRLYVGYTKINVSLEGSQIVLKWSDDWGGTWSEETPIPVPTPLGVAVTGFQYLDDERAVMTVSTNSHDPLECTGKIGYFHFSDCSYDILCEVTGPEWCIAAGTFEGELAMNGAYHVAWAHEPVLQGAMSLKYAWTKDITFPDTHWRTPLVMGDPPDMPGESGSYQAALHGTDSDVGEGSWRLRSNCDGLDHAVSEDGSCEVTGTPTETGEFWVNLTLQDDDSSDSFNWTVVVTEAVPEDPAEDDPADEEPEDDPADDEESDPPALLNPWMFAVPAAICGAVIIAALLIMRRRV